MMDTVLSLVDLVHEDEESGFFNLFGNSLGNSGDSNNCGSHDSRGC